MADTKRARAGQLEQEWAACERALAGSELLSDQSRVRFIATADRFFTFCQHGFGLRSLSEVAAEVAAAFVTAPLAGGSPSVATMHLRRSVVRFLFRLARELDFVDGDPCIDLRLPPRSSLRARPLTDDEVSLCRSYALTSLTNTRTPAAWALAEASARTAEIPHIRARDVALDNGSVWLHGSPRTNSRCAPLTPWGAVQLARRIAQLHCDDDLVVYQGKREGASAQASSCIAIADTLTRAGLGAEPDVRPASVAAWAGRIELDRTGHIEDAACLLGVRSLDRAAAIVGWDWAGAEPQPA